MRLRDSSTAQEWGFGSLEASWSHGLGIAHPLGTSFGALAPPREGEQTSQNWHCCLPQGLLLAPIKAQLQILGFPHHPSLASRLVTQRAHVTLL